MEDTENLSKEDRLERLELIKEEQATELKAVELTIDKVSELSDILPCNSTAKDELKKFLNKLINEKGFQEQQIKEVEQSIDYVKGESKGIKSVI